MKRALIDEVVPADLAPVLSEGQVTVDTFPQSWRSSSDGAILTHATASGYAWLITCDKRMPFQQNLAGRSISVLVLPTPRMPELHRIRQAVCKVLGAPIPGNFVILDAKGLPVGRPTPNLSRPKRTR